MPLRRLKNGIARALVILCFFSVPPALATDHIDGKNTVYDPSIDLTDLFAFTTGDDGETLVVVLNTVTAAMSRPPSSDAIFNILLSEVSSSPDGHGFTLSDELPYQISCTWKSDAVSCIFPGRRVVDVPLGVIAPPSDIRVFGGLRSDPFYLNGRWAIELQSGNSIPEEFSSNAIEGLNVFGLVVEIDLSQAAPGLQDSIIAVGAEVMDGAGIVQDRIGRPEIANIAIQSNDGPDLRNELNGQRALAVSPSFREVLETRLRQNLDRYDDLSPSVFQTNKDQLARILADDYLTIDTRLPCSNAQYFELETALLESRAAMSCGGRPIDEDIIDAVYGLLINGSVNEPVPDGANSPTTPSLQVFPYLAPPNVGVKAWLDAVSGRLLASLSVEGPRRGLILALGALFLILSIFGAVTAIRRSFGVRRQRLKR